jgi:Subunit 11 of the general transcription factor TFIIH
MRGSHWEGEGNEKGFTSFTQVAKELDKLLDLIWISGTPSLQVSYLLSLALMVAEMLPEYAPAPRATFRLLGKLDAAFASLLAGVNVETGEALPGFEKGRVVSTTEKVRIKSLVDRTRIVVVRALREGGGSTDVGDDETEEVDDTDTGDDDDLELEGDDDLDVDREEMGIAKIYDRTVVELGDVLGGSPIGIITDD